MLAHVIPDLLWIRVYPGRHLRWGSGTRFDGTLNLCKKRSLQFDALVKVIIIDIPHKSEFHHPPEVIVQIAGMSDTHLLLDFLEGCTFFPILQVLDDLVPGRISENSILSETSVVLEKWEER